MKDEVMHLAKLPKRLKEKNGNKPLLWYKNGKFDKWVSIGSDEFCDKVNRVAYALKEKGIQPEDKLAIYSQNRPESIVADFANFRLRAITIPVYATCSKEQVKYIVNDAKVKVLYAGDQKQTDVAIEVMKETDSLKLVVAMNDAIDLKGEQGAIHYSDLEKEGKADESAFEGYEYGDDDIATIMYTSGTTGDPKGVVLRHYNYEEALLRNQDRLITLNSNDRVLNFLPISHVFERAWSYLCLTKSVQLYINYNPKDIMTSLKEVSPTLMCAVPRFWEKVYLGILRKISMMSPMMKGLTVWAMEVGRKYHTEYSDKGKEPYWWLRVRYKLVDKLIFNRLRKTLGIENGNFFPVAGSSLSDQILIFLRSLGIPILYGYGLTESTATVACYDYKNYRVGSVGRVLDGIEVKIGEDDEILLKGKTITSGYYNREEENKKCFTEDGFFRTGDAGRIENGHLYLTERIKDLFKTSNGKYIAPQQIEMRLAANQFIEQAIVIGDKRNYVTAIVVPNFEALTEEAKKMGIDEPEDKLIKDERIYKFYESEIEREQSGMAPFEHIKKFTLIRKGFTLDGGELTNTLKYRRAFITQKYSALIDAMYDKRQ